MLNTHKLFYDAPKRVDFLAGLNVAEGEKKELATARELIRATLRENIAGTQQQLGTRQLLTLEAMRKSIAPPSLRLKFRMQGSASYDTLNEPAQHPPQQIDYDDGIYSPISFLAETRNPILASSGYFKLVESALAPLCESQAWTLRTDKASCVRVEISQKAHIDLPLYAIPDKEFDSLTDAALLTKADSVRTAFRDALAMDESIYQAFLIDEMRMAHREQGWIKSDPRLIERWFGAAVDAHGYQLRRVCRYFKAWRDHKWSSSRLTSITIMKCVVDAFDELKGFTDPKRDDLAVLEVAARLEKYFRSEIQNPVLDAVLNDNWTMDDRHKFIQGAQDLYRRVSLAVKGTADKAIALAQLTDVFGSRIPQDLDLITQTAEATVRSFVPTKVAAPYVPRTTSG